MFSGQLLLDLAEHGMSREDAYRLVQSHAMRAWKEDLNFRELVMNDKEITSRVPRKSLIAIVTSLTITCTTAARDSMFTARASRGKMSAAPPGRKSLHVWYLPVHPDVEPSVTITSAAFSQSTLVRAGSALT